MTGHAAGRLTVAPVTPDFVLVSIPGSAPNTLIVQRGVNDPEITVTISPTATIVRRYNGKSDLSELNVGDHLVIKGTRTPPAGTALNGTTAVSGTTILASAIKDTSIQVGYSQINGRVLGLSRAMDQLDVQVTANEGNARAAFPVGEFASIVVSPTTVVNLLGKPGATIADVRPGMVLTMYGLSDSTLHTMLAPHDITQLLGNTATRLTKIAPSDSTAK